MSVQTAGAAGETYRDALASALDDVRACLAGTPRDGHVKPDSGAALADSPSALDQVVDAFGLSRFERLLLVLCAGVELDSEMAAACAAAQNAPERTQPTFGLALAKLPDAHWSAVTPAGPLRYWRLVEVPAGGSLATSPLRIDERILHYLLGAQYLDERLEGLVGPALPARELPGSQASVAATFADGWLQQEHSAPWPLIVLIGSDRAAKPAVAAAACARLGLDVRVLSADAIPAAPIEQDGFRRLWAREAALGASALLVDCEDVEHDEPGRAAAAARFLDQMPGPVAAMSSQPLRSLRRLALALEVRRPALAEQREIWRSAIGADVARANGFVDQVVTQFDLSSTRIAAAVLRAANRPDGSEAGPPETRLWEACRAQSRVGLDDLAQRIEPAAGWDDLVLPDAQHGVLRQIAAHVRHRAHVYDRWGFAAKGTRGLGIAALFAGPSGTGKTMAAEVIAGDLRLDLYRVDLSSVVSKYIGETEKNLRRVFDAAEEGGAILLFDEADALFGKRTEVKDSHDRYANIEVSYLLQRMEAYRGLAILTTNVRSALDTAFLRRLRFVVEFPFPGALEREAIWRRIFPAETPTEPLDVPRLARLNVAGGGIRNIALNAAFLAAAADEPVRMSHLFRAARSEYAKLEQPLTGTETEGWT